MADTALDILPLARAKRELTIPASETDDDALLTDQISAAVSWVEKHISAPLLQRRESWPAVYFVKDCPLVVTLPFVERVLRVRYWTEGTEAREPPDGEIDITDLGRVTRGETPLGYPAWQIWPPATDWPDREPDTPFLVDVVRQLFPTPPGAVQGVILALREIYDGKVDLRPTAAMHVWLHRFEKFAPDPGVPFEVLAEPFIDLTVPQMPVPDAAAPTVNIVAVTNVETTATQQLSAHVSGGHYDTIAYLWRVVSGGGSITGSGATVTYHPPATPETGVEVEVDVTVTGTGTNAQQGTTDTASDTETFDVVHPPPTDIRYAYRLANRQAPPAVPTVMQWLSGNTSMSNIIDSPGGGQGTVGRKCFATPAALGPVTRIMQQHGFLGERGNFLPALGDPNVTIDINGATYNTYVEMTGSGGVDFDTPYILEHT